MNKLDHVVTNNIRTDKNRCNDAIENEPIFDNKFSLSSSTKDPLPVVTVGLRLVHKQREKMVSVLTYLWDSGATDSMIKIKNSKHFEHIIFTNKEEYNIAA